MEQRRLQGDLFFHDRLEKTVSRSDAAGAVVRNESLDSRRPRADNSARAEKSARLFPPPHRPSDERRHPRRSQPPRAPDHGDRLPAREGHRSRGDGRAPRSAHLLRRARRAASAGGARPRVARDGRQALRLPPHHAAQPRPHLGAQGRGAHLLRREHRAGGERPARGAEALRRRARPARRTDRQGARGGRSMSAPQLAAVFAVLVDAALRGSVILLAALAATRLMKGRSAAARHLVWVVALLSMLSLPILARVLPEWRVVPVPAPLRPMAGFVAAPAAVAPPVVSAQRESPSESVVASPAAAAAETSPPATRAASPAPAAPAPFDWKSALMALWMVGGALVVLRLAYGIVRVWWMERRAVEITDDGWVRIADGLARRLRVGRVVTLLREAHAVVPMTWGVVRPVVLLPADAEEWDTERRTVVLAHELAHVRRWDTLTQWIAHLAIALFWFNPLVWMAARQMREEREHACDDAVLSIGTRPVEYADHLLDIVRSLGSAEGPAAALAMARRSQFEGRLLAILDNATPRGGVSRGLGLAALVLAAAAVLPLGALRAARPAEALASPLAAAKQTAVSAPPQERPGKYPLASMAGKLARIVDRAIDAI